MLSHALLLPLRKQRLFLNITRLFSHSSHNQLGKKSYARCGTARGIWWCGQTRWRSQPHTTNRAFLTAKHPASCCFYPSLCACLLMNPTSFELYVAHMSMCGTAAYASLVQSETSVSINGSVWPPKKKLRIKSKGAQQLCHSLHTKNAIATSWYALLTRSWRGKEFVCERRRGGREKREKSWAEKNCALFLGNWPSCTIHSK